MRAGWAWVPGPFLSAFLLQTQDPGQTSRERPALVGAADPGPTEQRPAREESYVSATLLGPEAPLSPEGWEPLRTWQAPQPHLRPFPSTFSTPTAGDQNLPDCRALWPPSCQSSSGPAPRPPALRARPRCE